MPASDAIEWLLDHYPPMRQRPYGGNDELDRMFATLADTLGLAPSRRLAVEWSYGKGKWAAVPWLAIMDPRSTTTTQRGIYVVFLFRADGSGVYLALGQGITEVTREEGVTKGHEQLRARSASIAASIAVDAARRGFETSSPMDLRSDLPRPKAYEHGAIAHKLYGRDTLPSDEQLRADVDFLLDAYARILDAATSSAKAQGPRRTWLMALGESARYLEPLYAGGLIGIGWNYLGDLTAYASQEAIAEAMRDHDGVQGSRRNDALACYNFAKQMKQGDRVFIKRGTETILGAAIVSGDYRFDPEREDYHHVREVEWTHKGNWTIPGLPVKTLTEFTPYADFVVQIEALLDGRAPAPARPVVEPQEELRAYAVEDALDGLFIPRESVERLIQVWRAKKNLILQGPPGVGKSFIARRLAYVLMGKEDPSRVQLVQFHQSYAYEDFIQGFRPGTGGGFELRDGPFLEFCRRAHDDPEASFVFIIDEINRGNLSKILGETLMLLEADKRSSEWAVSLAYANKDAPRFHVPPNVNVLGLMNTADRSLAVVDYALRRRFAFATLEPGISNPAFRAHLIRSGVTESVASRAVSLIGELNEAIGADTVNLGPGFRIGHSFFCRPPGLGEDSDAWWRAIVETEILPLLEEYYFGHPSGPATLEDWSERLLSDV
jgi:hypothetical protein